MIYKAFTQVAGYYRPIRRISHFIEMGNLDLGVGMMLVRPLDHGAACSDPARRFALASGVDTVLYSFVSDLGAL